MIINCPKCNASRSNEIGPCPKCRHDPSVTEIFVPENQREVIQASLAAKATQAEAREAQIATKRRIFAVKEKIEEGLSELWELANIAADEKYDLIEKQMRPIIDRISQIPH